MLHLTGSRRSARTGADRHDIIRFTGWRGCGESDGGVQPAYL